MNSAMWLQLWVATKPVVVYLLVTCALNLIISERSRIDAWCAVNPRAAAALKILRAVGFDPWHMVTAFSLAWSKRLPSALNSTILMSDGTKVASIPPGSVVSVKTDPE